MPAKGQKRRILHTQYIKNFQKIKRDSIWPGIILRFRYESKGRYDRQPLILCLAVDTYKDVVHGVNFNYLNEFKVQRLFTFINGIIRIDDNNTDIKTVGASTSFIPDFFNNCSNCF